MISTLAQEIWAKRKLSPASREITELDRLYDNRRRAVKRCDGKTGHKRRPDPTVTTQVIHSFANYDPTAGPSPALLNAGEIAPEEL